MDPEQMTRPPAQMSPPATGVDGRMEKLSETARGWHTIQIAVLGFVGICGILHSSDAVVPKAIQLVAGVLAAGAFVLSLLGVLTVGRVAYPLDPVRSEADLRQRREQLRGGIRITVVALAMVVIAALSGWWPHSDADAAAAGSASLSVSDAQGRSWCGTLVAGPDGAVSLQTADGVVAVPSNSIASIATVAACS